jgi:hypothetical protein
MLTRSPGLESNNQKGGGKMPPPFFVDTPSFLYECLIKITFAIRGKGLKF